MAAARLKVWGMALALGLFGLCLCYIFSDATTQANPNPRLRQREVLLLKQGPQEGRANTFWGILFWCVFGQPLVRSGKWVLVRVCACVRACVRLFQLVQSEARRNATICKIPLFRDMPK